MNRKVCNKSAMSEKEEAAAYWDKMARGIGLRPRSRWWEHPRIIAHINKNICGKGLSVVTDGAISLIKANPAFKSPLSGISIGCGSAGKEISLIQAGIASHFDLYEISSEQIALAKENARACGLSDKINFMPEPPDFDAIEPLKKYSLVYWDNALHHMPNAMQALAWSRNVLQTGGFFLMNDYVGPSRFQWTDFNLAIASNIRAILPDRLLYDPSAACGLSPKTITRPKIDEIIAMDPSEAADSSSILAAIKKYFPDAIIKLTGGCIYHLCLNDILANFKDGEDDTTLDLLLFIDDICATLGQTHYAVAMAIKDD